MAPLIRKQKGEYRDLFVDLLKQGFVRARVDGRTVSLSDDLRLDRQMRHDIEVVVDRLTINAKVRAAAGRGRGPVAEGRQRDTDHRGPGGRSRTLPMCRFGARPAVRLRRSRRVPHGDIIFSSDYACTHCGLSFEPPTPQLFSFNSPQGMCLECDGLGEKYSFDRQLLVPRPQLTFKQGCIEILGGWKDMGRWRRHIYQGIADTVERLRDLAKGTLLETPWEALPAELQDVWLWGTGDQHITFTWRGGAAPLKYGGTFAGIVPELRLPVSQHEEFPSAAPARKVHADVAVCRVSWAAAEPAGAECPHYDGAARSSAIIRPGHCRRSASWRCGMRWSSFSSCSWGRPRR